jgi:hypothetical protein
MQLVYPTSFYLSAWTNLELSFALYHNQITKKRRTSLGRVWRYQRSNQNPYIEQEQTTQWPKEKVQKEKQRSTKHTHKTKDRVTRTPLKTGGELRYSERVSSYCSTSGFRRVNLVTNLVIVMNEVSSETTISAYWKWGIAAPKLIWYPSFLDIDNDEWLRPNSYDIPDFWIWTMTNDCAQIRMTYTDFRHAIVAK